MHLAAGCVVKGLGFFFCLPFTFCCPATSVFSLIIASRLSEACSVTVVLLPCIAVWNLHLDTFAY